MDCRRLRGAVNIVTIVFAMTAVALIALGPTTAALLPATSKWQRLRLWWRKWTSASVSAWLGLVAALIEGLLGVRFVVTGTPLPSDAHVVIMNHRTRLDWALLWPVARRAGVLHAVRIALKASLRMVPFGGYAMQLGRFLFLHRKYEIDAPYIGPMLRVMAGEPTEYYSFLIFPEGTDLHPGGITKSDAYAAQHGLERRVYTMHPRSRGFQLAIQTLRGAARPLQHVCDATIAFSDGEIAQGEDALWTGMMPRIVHVHVEAYDANAALPGDDVGLAVWLTKRFAEKEAALALFYEHGYGLAEAFDVLRGGVSASTNDEDDIRRASNRTTRASVAMSCSAWIRRYLAPLCACAAALAVCILLLSSYPREFGIYVAVYLVVNIIVTSVFGGWQRFEIALEGEAPSPTSVTRGSSNGGSRDGDGPATAEGNDSPLTS